MLALTPEPLQTAGERALFAELARWDTGAAVRAAVVASLPLVDGPMGRRISDAVLFVPEGLAVVRIAEVPGQRGVVTAVPEGSWSIAPDGGPGDVLQIAGGGSSPLDGLMRAGMEAAFRLRQAGLEPGRIARLTVLVGDLTGLQPADGDLGEGDQVALLESRSLLLGIARSARYAGVDNPRLWTTADVRTALEVLGLPGRGPTVEELNGEGFPYSPYVLRRRELLTPAAMNAASAAATAAAEAAASAAASVASASAPAGFPSSPPSAAPAGGPVTGGFVAAGPRGPRVDPAAAAAVAVAAIRADEAAAAHRATVAAEARVAAAPAPVGATAPAQASAPAPFPVAEETDGIGGLFGPADATDPASSGAQPTLVAPLVAPPERSPGVPLVVARKRPGRVRRAALAAGAALLIVLVVGLVIGLGGDDGGGDRADADPAPTTSAAPRVEGPQPGTTRELDGLTFTLQQVEQVDTCADHAYGRVAAFFETRDCFGLARALWSTDVGGDAVVVSVAAVDMGDEVRADDLRTLADTDGSGNVNDLLTEGVRYPGGPDELTRTRQYASGVDGTVVTIVETDWVGTAGSKSDLDLVAGTALALDMPDPTA